MIMLWLAQQYPTIHRTWCSLSYCCLHALNLYYTTQHNQNQCIYCSQILYKTNTKYQYETTTRNIQMNIFMYIYLCMYLHSCLKVTTTVENDHFQGVHEHLLYYELYTFIYIHIYIYIYYNYYYIQLLTLYETFIRFVVCSLSFVLLQDNFKFHFALIVS